MPDGAAAKTQDKVPGRMLVAISAGTLLNPLNSSMIAVALIGLSTDFRVNLATATWLVSSYYLAGAVGQPLMGRLGDLFGPRRVFSTGLVLVGIVCAAASFAPSFAWLVAVRILQALGTSSAYPSGLAIIRNTFRERSASSGGSSQPPASALGVISVFNNVSAALGPTLGGFLVALFGWHAIFLINLPIILAGFLMVRFWLPPDPKPAGRETGKASFDAARLFSAVDLAGVLLFTLSLISLLAFLLSLSTGPLWLLLPTFAIGSLLLILRERKAATPFLNVRMLVSNRKLTGVYLQYAVLNLVFYSLFFGLPLWLEEARSYNADQAGLILLPFTGLGVITTFIAAKIIRKSGFRVANIIGSGVLLVGTLLLLLLDQNTSLFVILVVAGVLGIPNGFNNLGLQAALYNYAPPKETGAAAGLFLTFRYVGSILSASLLGLVFAGAVSSDGLHSIAFALAALSGVLIAASIRQ